MQIKNLKINQYKSIKNLNLHNLPDINILIGPNNSGKSNILDAIESACMPFDDSIFFADQQSDYEIEFEIDSHGSSFFSNSEKVLKVKRVANEKKYFLGQKELNDLDLVDNFFKSKIIRFNGDLVENIQKIRDDYADLKKNHQSNFKKLWQVFHKIFPDIDEIISSEISSAENIEIKARLKKGGKIVEYERLGTGVRRVFTMMLYVFHPRYCMILMNEPETHLHPALVKKVVDLLRANVKDEQIFLTTHSPIFITPENLKQVYRTNKGIKEMTEVFYFKDKDTIDSQRLVQEFNADNLEMFFADKVIIVEGISDKILVRGLIDKFYKGYKEIKVVDVSGKGNIGVYLKLVDIFRIPYLVLLDRDALQGFGVKALQKYIPNYARKMHEKINSLKKHGIYVLPNGTIEKNYPRRYQKKDTKPLNALYAVSQISENDFNSNMMRNLREVIEAL